MKTLGVTLLLITCLCTGGYAQEKQLPPPGGEPLDFSLPEKEIVRFDNGLELVMVEWGAIPKATISFTIKTGNIHEGENEVWLADLMADLMEEGSTSMSGNDIADAMAGMGGELNIGVGMHTMSLNTSVLYEFTPEAINIMADVLMNPAFPKDEMERLINDRKRQVSVSLTQPQPIAQQAFLKSVYPDHPYGRVFPTEEMLDSYTVDAVRNFYNSNLGGKRTTVYVVGQFDASAVKAKIEETLATWQAGPESSYPTANPVTGETMEIINRAGAPQSTLIFGIPVIDQSNPDWIPLEVTNSLLGGSFGSRITSNIREDKGYTYSPFSTVDSNYKSAVWYEQADVTTSVTGPSLREITKEIYKLQNEAPSQEELEGIQNYAAGIFVLQNSTPGGIIGQMVNMVIHDLDDSYLTKYVQNIYKVTPEQVQEMTRKYLDPEKMTLIMVGDKESIEQQMKDYSRTNEAY